MALKDLVIGITLDTKTLTKSLGHIEKKLKTTAAGFNKMGDAINKSVTLPAGLAAFAAGKMAVDFDDAMRRVAAISGATGDDLQKLSDTAREMGRQTKFSATESAEALKFMALAGFDTQQQIAALPGVLSLAAAAGMELATASDITTDTMSAFGLEASKATEVADMLAKAQSKTNTSVEQLGEALKYAAAGSAAAGQSLASTNVMLGIFGDQGVKGSMAGTTLANMLKDLQTSAEDGKVSFGDMSVSVYDATGNMRDIVDIMSDVQSATKDMTAEERYFALTQVFKERALRGAQMALASGEERMKFLRDEINNSTGAAEQMAEVMEGGIGGAMRRLQSQTADLGIQIGIHLVPIMENMIGFVSRVVDRFASMDAGTQKLIIALTGAVAAIGLMSKAIGIAMTMAANYAGAIKILTVATTAATVKFKAMDMVMKATTIGAVIAVVVAGVAAFKSLSNAMDTTTASQKLLQSATTEATAAVSREIYELETVNKRLEKNKDNRDEIRKAVLELQKINPEYFGDLDAEKSSYNDLSKAIGSYTDNIKKAAETRVLSRMLDEQLEAVVKFEAELAEKTGRSAGKMNIYSKLFGDQRDVRVAAKGLAEAQEKIDGITKRLQDIKNEGLSVASVVMGDVTEGVDIEALEQRTKDFHASQAKAAEEKNKQKEKTIARDRENAASLQELITKHHEFSEAVGRSLNAMGLQITSQESVNASNDASLELMKGHTEALLANSAALDENNRKKAEAARLEEAQQEATALGVKVLRDATSKNIKSVKELGQAVLSSALDVAKAKALEGIFSAVSSALSNVPFPLNILAAGAAAGSVSILFNNLQSRLQPPKLAEGGIAYGRTLAEVGEYQGVQSNPEVIAPLSKLRDILGGINNNMNGMVFTGDFRIHGQDLLLTQIRANEFSNRQGRN
jgi:TP901 family phage tail tape measure protein